MINTKRLSVEQAWQKIKHYCAYQERSHYETKEKLYGFGLFKTDVETLLARLIEENFLNEERFARQFARGRFNLKKWGRIKIVYELKLRKVSPFNIKIALTEIDEPSYNKMLQKLADDKWALLKGEHYLTKQAKATSYLLQKGYEAALVQQAVKGLARAKE